MIIKKLPKLLCQSTRGHLKCLRWPLANKGSPHCYLLTKISFAMALSMANSEKPTRKM
jgi:hypothetical protein